MTVGFLAGVALLAILDLIVPPPARCSPAVYAFAAGFALMLSSATR